MKREFKVIRVRPLPHSQTIEAGKVISSQTWENIFNAKLPNEKVEIFHFILTKLMSDFFPEKFIKVSLFDKKWFNPTLRNLHRKKQREFVKNCNSQNCSLLNQTFNEAY